MGAVVSATPLKPGHCIVFPVAEIDSWLDASPEVLNEVMAVAQQVGRAIRTAYQPVKVGLVVGGIAVRHLHVHLVPIDTVAELEMHRQRQDATAEELVEVQRRVVAALTAQGNQA